MAWPGPEALRCHRGNEPHGSVCLASHDCTRLYHDLEVEASFKSHERPFGRCRAVASFRLSGPAAGTTAGPSPAASPPDCGCSVPHARQGTAGDFWGKTRTVWWFTTRRSFCWWFWL